MGAHWAVGTRFRLNRPGAELVFAITKRTADRVFFWAVGYDAPGEELSRSLPVARFYRGRAEGRLVRVEETP